MTTRVSWYQKKHSQFNCI